MKSTRSLIDELFAHPQRFDFFQAVRLLVLSALEDAQSGRPKRIAVGEDGPPTDETVRFRSLVSHSFPVSSIAHLRRSSDGDGRITDHPPEMTVAFFGLTGPSGVLPQHYTQLLIERVRQKDLSYRDFLDLFHHRLVSLFYRAWEKYHFPVGFERSKLDPDRPSEDLFTHCLYSLIGMGTEGLRGRQAFPSQALLYFGGLYAHQRPCAVSLEAVVSEYFNLPTDVIQFRGTWLYLPPEQQTDLGGGGRLGLGNNQLGVTAIAGDRVWDVENTFRIRLGPLNYRTFRRLLPSADMLTPLAQMVRTYVGPDLSFEIQPVLRAADVPTCRIGGDDGSNLGWDTWLFTSPPTKDAEDAVFAHEGAPLH
jgi:type VI secretion system protein ImpH